MYHPLRTLIANFVRLSEAEWAAVAERVMPRTLGHHAYLHRQGDTQPRVAFVAQGAFRIFLTTADGREVCTEFVLDGALVSESTSLVHGQPALYDVQALEAAHIWQLHWEGLPQPLLRKLLQLRYRYHEQVCTAKAIRRTALLAEAPAVRLALLQQQHPEYLRRIPAKYLASYLQLSPEHFSRLRSRQQHDEAVRVL